MLNGAPQKWLSLPSPDEMRCSSKMISVVMSELTVSCGLAKGCEGCAFFGLP